MIFRFWYKDLYVTAYKSGFIGEWKKAVDEWNESNFKPTNCTKPSIYIKNTLLKTTF